MVNYWSPLTRASMVNYWSPLTHASMVNYWSPLTHASNLTGLQQSDESESKPSHASIHARCPFCHNCPPYFWAWVAAQSMVNIESSLFINYYYYYYYKCQDYSDTIAKNAAGALYKMLCQNLQLTLCNK